MYHRCIRQSCDYRSLTEAGDAQESFQYFPDCNCNMRHDTDGFLFYFQTGVICASPKKKANF
ncbi:unnamed protein product [Onchocerca flexuosa]|uniref:Chitin-binding type-2 domain-containing protein n=1 Tax=Onchocerca flexuosa TaxID=387005 RepID=A0A183HQA7_9BILA|nr:unnamed protein product [Onchocerca flexuosa]